MWLWIKLERMYILVHNICIYDLCGIVAKSNMHYQRLCNKRLLPIWGLIPIVYKGYEFGYHCVYRYPSTLMYEASQERHWMITSIYFLANMCGIQWSRKTFIYRMTSSRMPSKSRISQHFKCYLSDSMWWQSMSKCCTVLSSITAHIT